jgi:hypothetical protein
LVSRLLDVSSNQRICRGTTSGNRGPAPRTPPCSPIQAPLLKGSRNQSKPGRPAMLPFARDLPAAKLQSMAGSLAAGKQTLPSREHMNLSLIVAGLMALHLLTTRRFAALALQSLPSTVAHELSHFLVALLLGCRPSGFSLIPKRLSQNHWQLGSVTFTPGKLSTGFVALAPLWVLGAASYWILWLRPQSASTGEELLWGVLGGFTAWAAIPSSTDVALALRYPAGTALLACICALVLA